MLENNSKRLRKDKITQLAKNLCRANIQERVDNAKLKNFLGMNETIRESIRRCGVEIELNVANINNQSDLIDTSLPQITRKRCPACKQTDRKDYKVSNKCCDFQNFFCMKHCEKMTSFICKKCIEKNN